jgi:hypothetical protein
LLSRHHLTTAPSTSSTVPTTNALNLLNYQPPQPHQTTLYIYIYIYIYYFSVAIHAHQGTQRFADLTSIRDTPPPLFPTPRHPRCPPRTCRRIACHRRRPNSYSERCRFFSRNCFQDFFSFSNKNSKSRSYFEVFELSPTKWLQGAGPQNLARSLFAGAIASDRRIVEDRDPT